MSATPETIALSLLAAAMFAVVALTNRIGLAHGTIRQVVLVDFVVMAVIFVAVAAVVLPRPIDAPMEAVLLFAVDGVLSVLAVIFLYIGSLRLGPSIASAIKNTSPVPAVVLAAIFLGEIPELGVLLGGALVVGGVIVLSTKPGSGLGRWRADVVYPLAGAGFFAIDSIVRRSAVQQVDHPLIGATIAGVASVIVAVGWMGLTRAALPNRRAAAWFTVAGIAQAVGFLAMLTALTTGQIAIVIPLYTSSPIFVVLASHFLVRRFETITRRIVVGVVTVLVGVAIVTVVGTA